MTYRPVAHCARLHVTALFAGAKPTACVNMTAQDRCVDRKLTFRNLLSIQHLARHSKVITSCGQHLTQIVHPKTLIWEPFLIENGRQQMSNRSAGVDVYQCPSRKTTDKSPSMIILDNITSITSFYDCPVSAVVDDITTPGTQKSEILEGPGTTAPKMEAKIILRIRHKKMKKHQRKKLRKRMYFIWRKQILARKSKRMKIYVKEIEDIKKTGDIFNAEEFVKEQLNKAKKGGYCIESWNALSTKKDVQKV